MSAASLVETYLRDLYYIRSTGANVRETSFYGPLANLLNEVGKGLKPRVQCVLQIANQGAGHPDGGLFTADQLQKGAPADPLLSLVPARGVMEVKGPGDDAWQTADSDQVRKYWQKYRKVLVTNFREFVLAGEDPDGQPAKLESFRLADSESAFWEMAASSRRAADAEGDRFVEYLRRVLLHSATLTDPEDVAWFLASYARDAKSRIEKAGVEALAPIQQALEGALGLTFEGKKGAHFFRSTLVQTLFYGVFSAWVLWGKGRPAGDKSRFDWRLAMWSLHVPMIRALFVQIANPATLEPLNLMEVLDWTAAALNRVDRASFFARFEEGQAVPYFYEPFLEAFDPELRKDLGVWYTPPEVVRYMVARVDTVLREELDIPDGLADPRVYVLDPCTGTGSYVVEVIRQIAATLNVEGDALAAHDVKRAALERVFGFEILPAPFVVAHLQLGLLLQNLGAPLSDAKHERPGVYLTNALTGWEPPIGPQLHLPIPEMEEERDAAGQIKRDRQILVILGNPPYNGFADVAMTEERELSNAYRVAVATRQPEGQGLNDLYIRFFRMAERRIAEKTGEGVICFISNYSWLDGRSFPAMRERYLEVFDKIWIDCLNGDSRKTGKLTPEGAPDPSIFSTEQNREGIRVGTAVSLMVRKRKHGPADVVRFRSLWGKNKRGELLETAHQDGAALYQAFAPPNYLGLPFLPALTDEGHERWPTLPELFPVSFPGVKTSRDDVVVDVDRDRLIRRMEQYFDPKVSHEEIRRLIPSVMKRGARFDAEVVRNQLLKRGFLPENVVRYLYRPFDVRWLYWEPETKLLDEKRLDYFPQVFERNVWLSAGEHNRKEQFYQPQVTTDLADHHIVESNAAMFPLLLISTAKQLSLLQADAPDSPALNLTSSAREYLAAVDLEGQDIFHHCLAVLHAPAYADKNAGALRLDWPRIPLPESRETLAASSRLGRRVAALLDVGRGVPGVTRGAIPPELKLIGRVTRVGGGPLSRPETELAVTAGWSHAGTDGATMPGKGKVITREYTLDERAAVEAGVSALGLNDDQAFALLGETTNDVYLNEIAYWSNIPERVWRYNAGGYPVIKKWLSYRERAILGRSLTVDEAREVMQMARRIAGILLLGPDLDANYQAVKGAIYDWPKGATPNSGEQTHMLFEVSTS